MIDGQHRCEAVIESGETIRMLVVKGLGPRSREVIDTGAKRTGGDALRFAGFAQDPTVLAAAARIADARENGYLRTAMATNIPPPSNSDIIAWAELNPDVQRPKRGARIQRKLNRIRSLIRNDFIDERNNCMGLTNWLQSLGKSPKDCAPAEPHLPSERTPVAAKPTEFESNYLHSSRWEELLAPTTGLPNLRLSEHKSELWLMETTTSKLISVGNRHLAKLGIWTANVRGIDYHKADVRASDTTPGTALEIQREPDNPHDRNAIAVVAEGRLVGYVNKQMAAKLAKLMDAGLVLEVISLAGSPRGKNDSRIQILAADQALVRHLRGARVSDSTRSSS